jgi:hypothetical protein
MLGNERQGNTDVNIPTQAPIALEVVGSYLQNTVAVTKYLR